DRKDSGNFPVRGTSPAEAGTGSDAAMDQKGGFLMKRKWEKQLQVQLKRYYEAPPPQKKSEFFSSCPETIPAGQPKMRSLLWIQAGYIRKWSWGISLIIFLAGIWAAGSGRRELFQTLAAMMPFLALALTTETGRSARCNMEELELSC